MQSVPRAAVGQAVAADMAADFLRHHLPPEAGGRVYWRLYTHTESSHADDTRPPRRS
jgi:hypothetical protein